MKFDDSFFNEVYRLSQMGKADAAIEMLDMIPKNHSEYSRALFYKSMIMDDDGDGDALNFFKKAISIEYLNNVDGSKIEGVFDIAMECLFSEEFEDAIQFFDVCIEHDYNVFDSLKGKSLCLASMGLFDDANKCIDDALKIDDTDVEVLQAKATYLGELNDYDGALKWIDKAIEANPNSTENFQIKALTYFKMKNYDEAFEYADKVIDNDPDDIGGLILKIKFYHELEDYENEEKCFEIAESIDGDNLELLFAKTLYYISCYEFENANEYIDKCLKIEPQSDIFTTTKLAIVNELDDSDLLDDTLNEIYKSNPEYIDAILNDEPSFSSNSHDSPSKHALEEFIIYGKDYPSQSMNYNIFNVLYGLKTDSDINNVYSNIELMDLYSDEILTEVLLNNNYIQPLNSDEINIKKEASSKSPQELSELLKKEGIVASGKKKKLVKLAVKHVPPIRFCSNFRITDEGEEFLDDYAWFKIYDECLYGFDLNDVSKYIDEHDGDTIEVLDDYIHEHIDFANEKEDFEYLDDCYVAMSLFYMSQKDYENCLRTSLSEIILKLNPIYEYEICYALYMVINSEMIKNIKECLGKLDVNLESLFYEIWDLKDGETDFTSKEEGFEYLERALDGEDLDDLSEEYEEKYIHVICRD